MDITFYDFDGAHEQTLDKSTDLIERLHVDDVFFKGVPYDELYPSIIVKRTTYGGYNYVKLDDYETFYFVRRVIHLDMTRTELQLEKDVLYSNLVRIKNSYGIFKRSTALGSESMVDETCSFDNNDSVSFVNIDSGIISKFEVLDEYRYLLVYYDGRMNDTVHYPESDFITNPIDTYDDGIAPNIKANPYILGYRNNTNYRILDSTHLLMLARQVGNDSNLLSMIKGIYQIPLSTSETNELKMRVIITPYTKINLGTTQIDLNYDNVHMLFAPYSMRSRWVFESFKLFTTSEYQKFKYQNPFTKYEIWCPFVGFMEIPSMNIINRTVKIFYTFNWENGETTCNLYDGDSNTIIATKTANALLPIALSASNMRELEEKKTALTLNTIIGGVSSAVAVVGGVATGNVMAVASGAISGAKVASNAITGFTQLHPSGTVNLQNTNSSWQARLDFVVKVTTKTAHEIDKNVVGRPCKTYAQISSETGYCEVVNVLFSTYTGLCKDEIEKIRDLLSKGVYA